MIIALWIMAISLIVIALPNILMLIAFVVAWIEEITGEGGKNGT